MPSRKVIRVVLVVALAQALLGVGVSATRREPLPTSGALREVTKGGPSPVPRPVPGDIESDGAGVPPGAVASSPEQGAAQSGDLPHAPTSRSTPEESPALPIRSTYEKLTPQEQAHVDRGGEAIIDGRVVDGRYWRLSASFSGDEVCPQKSHWDPETGSGGSGGGGCSSKSEWGLSASGPAGDYPYLGMHGYAPAEAQEFEFIAKDGRRGRVGGVYRPEMGVSFYVAWLDCDGPDLERINALAADGRVVSSYSFEMFGEIGWPSWPCNAGE